MSSRLSHQNYDPSDQDSETLEIYKATQMSQKKEGKHSHSKMANLWEEGLIPLEAPRKVG